MKNKMNKSRNIVAKYAFEFNKPKVYNSKKAYKRPKYKNNWD